MSASQGRIIVQEGQVGAGAFAIVYAATEDATGSVFAYKKARTSSRVKRSLLRHEARVLQLLQGHRAVPTLVGYERTTHFEHIAMELLGNDLGRLVEEGYAVNPTTVLRVGEQMISALQHMRAHNIVHRDVKPSNILVALDDRTRVCLVDYGLARRLSPKEMATPPAKRYDPLESDKRIIGTVDWCSLHAHEGIDLRPRDDVESLAYTLFFLVSAPLDWKPISIPASAPPLLLFERKEWSDKPVEEGERERGPGEHSDSYSGRWNIGMVQVPSRAHSLTFPEDEAELLDARIPGDVHVDDEQNPC